MTETGQRHPFLDDLAEDVVLVCSVLRKPVRGRERVIRVVRAGAASYRSQTPIVLGSVGEHGFFEYEAELISGARATGLVSMLRDPAGKVVRLHIAFSGLGEGMEIAGALRERLEHEFPSDLFL